MDNLLPEPIVELAYRVVHQNRHAGLKLAVAESCTGGLVNAALTEISGSSAVLEYGFVTYANQAKTDLVRVDPALFKYGAVSEQVASAMAAGALRISDAHIAIAISGVAGPGGGTDEKPVGTVVFARAQKGEGRDGLFSIRKNFGSDKSRSEIRMAATLYALELLLPSTL